MTGHLSSLDLDEIAAALAPAPVRAHAEGCTACSARLAAVVAEREAIMASPRFRQTLARLPEKYTARRPRWLLWPALGTLAAAAMLFVVVRPTDALRAKGSASMALVDAQGLSTSTPRIGDEARLSISTGTHRYALVLALDEASQATVLWPAGSLRSGEAPPTGHASIQLRVTPGAVHLVAAFSERPLSVAEALDRTALPDGELRELLIRPAP